MRKIASICTFKTLETEIEKFCDQPWAIKRSDFKFGIRKIFFLPETPFLGMFNQFVHSQGPNSQSGRYISYTFKIGMDLPPKSIAEWNNGITRYLSQDEKNKDDNGKINLNPSNSVKMADLSMELIGEIFSETFIQQEGLTQIKILEDITVSKNSYTEGRTFGDQPLPIFRLCETRDDFRIILCVHPVSGEFQLAFTSREEAGIYTPFIGMIHDFFDYIPLMRMIRLDKVSFHEQAKHQYHPLIYNNRQFFEISFFEHWNETNAFEIISRSALRQVKLGEKIVNTCAAAMGPDSEGRLLIEKGYEKHAYKLHGKSFSYLEGYRSYINPEFDLFISLNSVDRVTEQGYEYLQFIMAITYDPFTSDRQQQTLWTWHNILEEIGK